MTEICLNGQEKPGPTCKEEVCNTMKMTAENRTVVSLDLSKIKSIMEMEGNVLFLSAKVQKKSFQQSV